MLQIIESEKLESQFLYVRYSVAESFSVKGRLSPLLNSVDIIPDVSMKIVVSGWSVTFFSTEKHSGSGVKTYRNTVAKAISNVVDIHRLIKMYTPECTKVYSFVFPKIGSKNCVTQLECEFVANPPSFKVVEKPLALSAVCKHVTYVIKSSLLWFINNASSEFIPHSFFVKLSDQELEQFGTMVKASDTCTQVATSQFNVVTDRKKYWKYIIQDSEALTVSNICKNVCKNDYLLHYHQLPQSSHLFESSAMLGPLQLSDAKQCLFDFAGLVKLALDALHAIKLAHLDVRIPNVCFDLNGGEQCKAVFIDLDRMQNSDIYSLPPFWAIITTSPLNGRQRN